MRQELTQADVAEPWQVAEPPAPQAEHPQGFEPEGWRALREFPVALRKQSGRGLLLPRRAGGM